MPRFVVRFGAMRTLGAMSSRQDAVYRRGEEVVIRSPRGLEIGQVLCEATEAAMQHLERPPSGSILRPLSPDDALQMSKILALRLPRIGTAERLIADLNLPMKLVDIEQLLGGERVIVYYVSEDRVDFRELVKQLAAEFQTRVEMHQIGVRDEAKLLADYGDCGKPVCCNTHLSAMPPVSMKMAKLQKATLDPSKISGRCGRLKCCLRYEFDTYEALHEQLPAVGTFVVTSQGRCRVVGQEILSEHLLVETEDHRRLMIAASEVLSRIAPKGRPPQPH